MKRLIINKPISVRWLTRELQQAGVLVSSVGVQDETTFYADIAEAHEALALTVIAAHNPDVNPFVLDRQELETLKTQISGELVWIDASIVDINTALGTVNAATLAQLRDIVSGMLTIQRRVLQEQKQELKAWRFVIRQILG